MAQLTPQGIIHTELPDYLEQLETLLRDAYGEGISLAAETPQGQMVGLLAAALVEWDELLVDSQNALSVSRSRGIQLDDLGTMLSIPRLVGTYSFLSVDIEGQGGTTLPVGSRVRTPNGQIYETAEEVTIPVGTSARAAVSFRSAAEGAVPAVSAGTVLSILSGIAGWETATVGAAGVTSQGRARESDFRYRQRYSLELARNARSSVESMVARLRRVDGVSHVRVVENATSAAVTTQAIAVPAYAVMAIVRGGTDAAVAAVVGATKPAGIPTAGTTTEDGISFQRVVDVTLKITLQIRVRDGFPGDGIQMIRDRIEQYVAGNWIQGDVSQFDRTGFQIGEAVDQRRLLTPISSVPGHDITQFSVQQQIGAAAPTAVAATPNLNHLYVIDGADDVTISVTS